MQVLISRLRHYICPAAVSRTFVLPYLYHKRFFHTDYISRNDCEALNSDFVTSCSASVSFLFSFSSFLNKINLCAARHTDTDTEQLAELQTLHLTAISPLLRLIWPQGIPLSAANVKMNHCRDFCN